MSQWKTGYRKAVALLLARYGYVVRTSPATSRWDGPFDYSRMSEMHLHAAHCEGWATTGEFDDFEWDEFAGTFAEPPWEIKRALGARLSCGCGEFADVRVVFRGTLSELIHAVLDSSNDPGE